MSSFAPSNATPNSEDRTVPNDGWYPALTVAACRAKVGLPNVYAAARIADELEAAILDVNASLLDWRATQTAARLAEVPATLYGDTSEKLMLYARAVHTLVRARLMEVSRDHDATGKGADRAERLEGTADSWRQASQEALALLTNRPRVTVELI